MMRANAEVTILGEGQLAQVSWYKSLLLESANTCEELVSIGHIPLEEGSRRVC